MNLKIVKATLMVAFLLLSVWLISKGLKSSEAAIDFKKLQADRQNEAIRQTSEQFELFIKNIGTTTDLVKPDILQSQDTLRLSMSIELLDTMKQYAYAGVLSEKIGDIQQSAWRFQRSADYFLMEAYSHKNPENEFMLVKRARVNLEKSLNLDPDNIATKINLAICLKNINDVQPPSDAGEVMRPIMLLRDVVEKQPDNPDAIYYLGKLAIESGQYEKAIERFKKLVSLQPQNPENYLELSEIYRMMGNEKESKLWADKAGALKK